LLWINGLMSEALVKKKVVCRYVVICLTLMMMCGEHIRRKPSRFVVVMAFLKVNRVSWVNSFAELNDNSPRQNVKRFL